MATTIPAQDMLRSGTEGMVNSSTTPSDWHVCAQDERFGVDTTSAGNSSVVRTHYPPTSSTYPDGEETPGSPAATTTRTGGMNMEVNPNIDLEEAGEKQVVLDIEHVPVDDDPREWSERKKVRDALGCVVRQSPLMLTKYHSMTSLSALSRNLLSSMD